MNINVCSLIKFGEKAHMESFFQDGLMYMNNLDTFRKIEDQELRGDKHEALYEQREVKNIRISLGSSKIGSAEKGFFQLWHDKPQGNIFSMYALRTTENLNDIEISTNCKKFGDTCVFILDIKEFIKRVKSATHKAGLEVFYAPVEYTDIKSFQGKWSIFRKPLEYSYQSELRFYIKSDGKGPFCLELGSLKDIAAITESCQIHTLKVNLK